MSKEKTIYELAKEFPEKTYKELERYRNEDRQQEAGICIMGEARKDRENAVDHYEDANYRQDDSDDVEVKIGHNETIWFRNECKRLVKERDKERKLRQEAEGELSILKGIETNRVKEAQARCDHLSLELDRIKRDNVNLYSRISELIEVDESHQKLNGKLQTRLTEVEEDNKKMARQIEDKLERARKAGL